jgi:hypothetical protein
MAKEEVAAEAGAPKKKGKMLIIILAVVGVLVIGGGVAAYLLLAKPAAENTAAHGDEAEGEESEEEEESDDDEEDEEDEGAEQQSETCGNKVCITSAKGRKIYQVCKAKIDMHDDESQSVFVFNDITRLEYQKMKLRQYGEHLEEFFYNNLKKEQSKAIKSLSSEQIHDQVGEAHLVVTSNIQAVDDKIASTFGEQGLKILRKSHNNKFSSTEYMQEIGSDINDFLEDLQESDSELEEQILMLTNPISTADLQSISMKLSRYSMVIDKMFDFGDLAIAVKTLSEFIYELSSANINDKQYKQLVSYLVNIKDDLRSWRLTNFIEQSSDNIHYLDASLMSSCLQLQMAFMQKSDINEDEDDDLGLDLF